MHRVFAQQGDRSAVLTEITASSPERLVEVVQAALLVEPVCAAPDHAAHIDGSWDEDTWTALVSVLVVAGVQALARRIFDMHAAVTAGDKSVLER